MLMRAAIATVTLAALLGPLGIPSDAVRGAEPAAGDAVRGAELFNQQCSYCHSLSARMAPRVATPPKGIDLEGKTTGEPQPDWPLEIDQGKRGPNLEGLFKRAPGAVKNFPYRMTLKTANPTWTEADLDYWIFNHARLVAADRADLIAYLKEATGG